MFLAVSIRTWWAGVLSTSFGEVGASWFNPFSRLLFIRKYGGRDEHLTDDAEAAVDLRVEFKYDVLGNRIEKSVDEDGDGQGAAEVARFAYDENGNAWADLDDQSSLTTRRLYLNAVDAVFARIADGDVDWYLTDRLGSVRDIMDSASTIQNHIDYTLFGKVDSESDPNYGDRYKFTAREQDPELPGTQYNRGRYLQLHVGLWMSEDPIRWAAGDANLYRYVGNNATNATDPSGFEDADARWWRLFGEAVWRYGTATQLERYTEINGNPERWKAWWTAYPELYRIADQYAVNGGSQHVSGTATAASGSAVVGAVGGGKTPSDGSPVTGFSWCDYIPFGVLITGPAQLQRSRSLDAQAERLEAQQQVNLARQQQWAQQQANLARQREARAQLAPVVAQGGGQNPNPQPVFAQVQPPAPIAGAQPGAFFHIDFNVSYINRAGPTAGVALDFEPQGIVPHLYVGGGTGYSMGGSITIGPGGTTPGWNAHVLGGYGLFMRMQQGIGPAGGGQLQGVGPMRLGVGGGYPPFGVGFGVVYVW